MQYYSIAYSDITYLDSRQDRQLLVTANVVPALMMEAIHSSETSARTRPTRRLIPQDGIRHIRLHENIKSYKAEGYCLDGTVESITRIPTRTSLHHIPEDSILLVLPLNLRYSSALARVVIYRLPTASARVQARVRSCEICCGQSRLTLGTPVSLVTHSTDCSTLIIIHHPELVQ
jgi:hypothetical protein